MTPDVRIEILELLAKSASFLDQYQLAFDTLRRTEALIVDANPSKQIQFTEEGQQFCSSLVGIYTNIVVTLRQLENFELMNSYTQKALDLLFPWVVEQGDISSLPTIISILGLRVVSCVRTNELRILKDDLQTVVSSANMIEDDSNPEVNQGLEQARQCYMRIFKNY